MSIKRTGSIPMRYMGLCMGLTASLLASSPAIAVELQAVLDAQPAEAQARYQWRHPKETLEFFELRPGMTVVEALPGGGWYSRILLPYLGSEGRLVGADYAADMWARFGIYPADYVRGKQNWVQDWTAEAEGWRGEGDAAVAAFQFGSLPDELVGTADLVLFIRALHNLARFEADGAYLTTALRDAHQVLKPGGLLGVVQHRAAADSADDWADGRNGYLKQARLIASIEAAGFELLASSEINANPADRPGPGDDVWRLPPSLETSRDDQELGARMEAIGESDRMTLKFRKR